MRTRCIDTKVPRFVCHATDMSAISIGWRYFMHHYIYIHLCNAAELFFDDIGF